VELDDATEKAEACCECQKELAARYAQETAERVKKIGDVDVGMTLAALKGIIRAMSATPGQRVLILISPGFLTINAQATSQASDLLDSAARANVTVNAMDARGLYTTNTEASEDRTGSTRSEQTTARHHRTDSVAAEQIMAELADGTGGTYFHNSNDLEGGFRILTVVPEYIYLLEISLDNVKQDGSYHPLKVKVNHTGLQLQARRGYFAPVKQKRSGN
jgi:VWFA-related protein